MNIPKEVEHVMKTLIENGFEAFLVGGCMRDLLLKRDPKDWDITTNAEPKEIQKIFPDSVYENQFGTVGIKTESEDPKLKIIEVTTFRIEGKYTDKRHPDEVKFAKRIEDDLARRDFTVNAIAGKIDNSDITLFDPFHGADDLKKNILRTVGNPDDRFQEDALRLMRAVRFAVELHVGIEKETEKAMKRHAGLLDMIAKERIRDEFQKIIMAPRAAEGIIMLEDFGFLKFVLPELEEGVGCAQNRHHIYTVFDHNVRALNYAVEKNYSFEVRLASLLHDIGKPKSKRGTGECATFHGHEAIGAKIALRALDRLKFPKDVIEHVVHLVRYHMFYYNVGEVSEAGVRRFLRRVGVEYIDELLQVREADRIGSNVAKAVPYKTRHLLFMIDKVKHDPIHPKMLKVDGGRVMDILHIEPGRKVGWILGILLEDVLNDPTLNTEEWLTKRTEELGMLSDDELIRIADSAKETKEEFEAEEEKAMKKKHKV